MDKNAFLDDTNLSSLHIREPRATSTLLPDQRHRRSRPACGDVAKNLFHGTSGDDSSLGILASNEYRDCSFLSTPVRSSTAEQAMAEETSSEKDASWYLRERFGVSMDDMDAQAMLGFEETFTDAAAQIIEQDEKQFNKEHLLDAFEEPSSMQSCGSAQFGEITRPSWMSSSGDDRITVSAYLRSKSAPMDRVLGFSKATPLEEPKKESAPDKMSIRDLVEQQLGLTMSTYKKQCSDESRETSQTSLHSEFSMEDSLGDAASSWSKGPVNKQTTASRLGHAAPSKCDSQTDRKAHGDCHFKRPQGTAPRARVPRTSAASPSSFTFHSPSSGLGTTSTLTASRIPPRVLSSRKQDGSHLPIRSKASHLSSGKRNVSPLKSPSRLLRKVSPIVPKSSHGARSINGGFGSCQRSGDLEFQLAGRDHELSLSSPDLRVLKNRGGDKKPLVLKSMCRSDDNLVPERDNTMKEGRLPARELFGSSRNSPKNSTCGPSVTSSSIQGSSHGSVLSNSEPLPAPSGLVLPVSFLQHSRGDLGTFCADAPQNVVLALVNPTGKSQCYQIQQLRSTINGRAPKHTETVIVQFPGQHPVAGGCVTEVQGSFLSMSPGFVEIMVGIFTVGKAGSDHESLHSMTLAAQVEQPCIALEPSQSITFEGLHFDAEQGSANSSSSREVNVINESSCAVPVVVCIRGGEGVFTVRAKEVDGIKDHATMTSLSVVLPSKKERAATSFVVDCSTHRADCLTVEAQMEVFLDGSLLSRRVLAGLGLRASIEPPSLTLEHVSTCKPLEVCCGRGRATSVWLKNNGPCPLDLELSAGALFNVSPGRFRIQAADHMELLISAAETAGRIGICGIDGRCEGVLEAAVMPQGFKVALISLVGSSDQHAASDATALVGASKRGASRDNKMFMTLESNRKFLLWAQVHSLASEERSLKIRNPNSNPINMEVSVSKPYHKVFQVKLQGGDSASASPNLCLDGNGSVEIHVVNANSNSLVTGASFIESRLVIRSYSGSYTDVNNVALYAFGGALKVELHDTLCLGRTRHLVDMGMPLAPGTVSSNSFTLVNYGDWDAFVYLAVPGSILDPSKESSDKAGQGTVSVAPSCFVLHRKKSKTVSLTYKFGATDAQMCAGGQVVTLSVIRVLFGFEALRQAAKRVFSKPTGCKRPPSELMSLFLGSFESEGKVDDVTVSAGVVEEVFIKTTSQVAVAVIASGGATTELIQSSTAASFAPLEDLTFLSRLSLSELPE